MDQTTGSVNVDLKWPVGGVVKRYGYSAQPPQTTPDAVNVRSYDAAESRERGGCRPGLKKALAGSTGANLIQMLSTVNLQGSATLCIASGGTLGYTRDGVNIIIASGAIDTEAGLNLHTESDIPLLVDFATLNPTAPSLLGAERAQKLYIADYSTPITGSGYIDTNGWLRSSGTVDWSAFDIYSHVATLEPVGVTGVQYGSYDVVETSGTGARLYPAPGLGACTFTVGRCPKVFDPVTGVGSKLIATIGFPPIGCPLVCRYRDRLVFAGPDNQWYMSRQSYPDDFDYGADPDDPGRAVAGSNADAGVVGEPVTALIPHSDDYLLFGCSNSLWVLRGDPAYGGQLDSVSRTVGVLSGSSWCNLPDGSVMFMGREGLYLLAREATMAPEPFSRMALPDELKNVDVSANTVSMEWDNSEFGIHVFVTPTSGSAGSHWWIDWHNKAFWKVVMPSTMQPTACVSYAASPSVERKVILGCRDMYLRSFDRTQTTDDGTAIASYIWLGPMRMAQDGFHQGRLDAMVATMDATSVTPTWGVSVGSSAEGSMGTARATGTFAAGRGRHTYPRVSGAWSSVKVSGAGGWVMEQISVKITPTGRQR